MVAVATSLEESKNNFRQFIYYSQSSTKPANFVKIGLVDIQIVLAEISNFLKTSAKQALLACALHRAGSET